MDWRICCPRRSPIVQTPSSNNGTCSSVRAVTNAVANPVFASAHVRATTAKYPPCIDGMLSAALPTGRFQGPFGCTRKRAYSFVLVSTSKMEFEATVLYHNDEGHWRTSNRDEPCRAHAVPKKIYQPTCETN
jgi:hypothetical protein